MNFTFHYLKSATVSWNDLVCIFLDDIFFP